jgi:2-aminoethylphosphonate-pyruvate transaminase
MALHAAHAHRQALLAGLQALRAESVGGRRARYSGICAQVVAGMREIGFAPILPPALQTPVCVAFRSERLIPDGAAFASYYDHLRGNGLCIYSKFHAESGSFRVGCIGQVQPEWVDDFLAETARFVRARRRTALPTGAGSPAAAGRQPALILQGAAR